LNVSLRCVPIRECGAPVVGVADTEGAVGDSGFDEGGVEAIGVARRREAMDG
jgi:hypothetical protein